MRNIRRELNSPSGTSAESRREERRKEEGGVGGRKDCEREGKKDMTRGKKKGDREGRKRREGSICQAGVVAPISVSTEFHKIS